MTDLEILKGMRELLSDPAHWTQGTYATTAEGRECEPSDLDAACFCLWGAAFHIGAPEIPWRFRDAFWLKEHMSLIDWQDAEGRTHDEIIAALDEAIALEAARVQS